MSNDFDAVIARAVAVRLTEWELVDQVEGLSRSTYWRAKTGKTEVSAQVRVLRKLEDRLTAIEAGRAGV